MDERVHMTNRLEKETKGAWIIHHGRKIALDVTAPAEFPVLDESAKAAELLMRLSQSDAATLTKQEIDAVARAAHLKSRCVARETLGRSRRVLINRPAMSAFGKPDIELASPNDRV
jgi:hypothetical protein